MSAPSAARPSPPPKGPSSSDRALIGCLLLFVGAGAAAAIALVAGLVAAYGSGEQQPVDQVFSADAASVLYVADLGETEAARKLLTSMLLAADDSDQLADGDRAGIEAGLQRFLPREIAGIWGEGGADYALALNPRAMERAMRWGLWLSAGDADSPTVPRAVDCEAGALYQAETAVFGHLDGTWVVASDTTWGCSALQRLRDHSGGPEQLPEPVRQRFSRARASGVAAGVGMPTRMATLTVLDMMPVDDLATVTVALTSPTSIELRFDVTLDDGAALIEAARATPHAVRTEPLDDGVRVIVTVDHVDERVGAAIQAAEPDTGAPQ